MLIDALVVLVIAVIGFVVYASRKPNVFRIERQAVIKAPPEKIFAALSDFAAWQKWSPWEAKDPAMARSLSGAAQGVGAVYEWNGNKNVGSGRMEIVRAEPFATLVIKLDFFTPFEAHNVAEFTLNPEGEATRVVWAMSGPSPLLGKILDAVFNMDKMVGKDFEAGLANLKRLVE